jgi:hypothetical protein
VLSDIFALTSSLQGPRFALAIFNFSMTAGVIFTANPLALFVMLLDARMAGVRFTRMRTPLSWSDSGNVSGFGLALALIFGTTLGGAVAA